MLSREFKLHFLAYAILISVTKILAAIVSARRQMTTKLKARTSIVSHKMKTGRIDALTLRERIKEHVKPFKSLHWLSFIIKATNSLVSGRLRRPSSLRFVFPHLSGRCPLRGHRPLKSPLLAHKPLNSGTPPPTPTPHWIRNYILIHKDLSGR